MTAETEHLVLFSSVRGMLTAALGPLLLIGASFAAATRPGSMGVGGYIVGGFGVLLGLAALFDYPRRCEMTPTGVIRVTAFRRHQLPWDRIDHFSRARGSSFANLRPARGTEPSRGAFGPLVAVVGRRRILLINQPESQQEYEAIRAALDRWAPGVAVGADRPSLNTPPTNLYRRKR